MRDSNSKLFLWAITASLAGFLFGFDMAVISGAEQKIQKLWQLNDFTHGLVMSIALWGTVVGALIGAWPSDKFGRKKTLLSIGILFLVSAIWSSLANDPYTFMVARFIGGLGVGISTIAAPLFISEVFPNRHLASGQSLGSGTHWVFAALLTLFFPSMVTAFSPASVFLFFAFMMVLQLLWVKLMVPETKGISLEEIEQKLGRNA